MLLMIVGPMSGSTGGGMKISRLMILLKTAKRTLGRIIIPNSVHVIHLGGDAVDEETTATVSTFFAVYLLLIRWINEYAANTVGYAVSFCCNFIITSYWTFGSKPSWKRLAGFSGSHLVNYLVQQIFLFVYLTAGIASEWAALLAMGSAVPVNFIMLRYVYRKP